MELPAMDLGGVSDPYVKVLNMCKYIKVSQEKYGCIKSFVFNKSLNGFTIKCILSDATTRGFGESCINENADGCTLSNGPGLCEELITVNNVAISASGSRTSASVWPRMPASHLDQSEMRAVWH